MRKDSIRVKKKTNPRPRPVVVINMMPARRFARRVFGFESCKPDRFLKSPDLDEMQIAVQLAKLEADMNWTKRLLWLMICGNTAGFYFS